MEQGGECVRHPKSSEKILPSSLKNTRENPPVSNQTPESQLDNIRENLSAFQTKLKDGREKKEPSKHVLQSWESFSNPPPQDNFWFVNLYGGNYASSMELDRNRVEATLKYAHLNGQVVLTSFVPSRKRSIEANSDGSVTAKSTAFWGENLEENETENPPYVVTSTPQGWRIEINDTKLREELVEKEKISDAKRLQKEFIKRFNSLTKRALFECVVKEKLTPVKDGEELNEKFGTKLIAAVGQILTFAVVSFPLGELTILQGYALLFPLVAGFNILTRPAFPLRKIDYPWEYFLPAVEIDKVIGSFINLQTRGRKLVKEIKQPKSNKVG